MNGACCLAYDSNRDGIERLDWGLLFNLGQPSILLTQARFLVLAELKPHDKMLNIEKCGDFVKYGKKWHNNKSQFRVLFFQAQSLFVFANPTRDLIGKNCIVGHKKIL